MKCIRSSSQYFSTKWQTTLKQVKSSNLRILQFKMIKINVKNVHIHTVLSSSSRHTCKHSAQKA
uniref:Uncharacterized protein n=1 Tax=Arion vulgaris TaxID=1028688 RepID=A0A0B6ZXU0_9EUPU